MVQEVSEGADGRWDRALLDVHVKGIGHDAAVRKACLPPHPGALVEPVEHVGAIAVPALQREVDTEGGGVLADFSYSLYGPMPLIVRIGDGLDARVRGRGDDEERGSELGGELGDLTQVSHGDVPDATFRMGQVAFRGEVRAHRADREPCIFGEEPYPLRVILPGLALDFDGIVSEAGKAVDRCAYVFALESDDIVRIAELLRHPLRPPAVNPLINR